jgi:hypothetical protein
MAPASHSRAPLYSAWRDRYEVVGKIGSGGFATVYEAVDRQLGGEVALKVVEDRPALSARVVREVEAARSLDHPAIVKLLDFFGDGRRSFLVWELVRGDPLDALADELGERDMVAAAAELCDALAYAHSRGIVHRDIKPENVMIDEDGAVKVMDFGIARMIDAETLTAEGEMLGTVAYMSPEQAAGRRIGPPTDVYSAGVVLYELLAGENPLRGATAAETIGNVLAGRIPLLEELRPDLPRELTDLVDAAVSPDPLERPTAVEMGEALRAVEDRLGGARFRAQRLLAPFRRLEVVGTRALGAAIAFACLMALCLALPGYPASWILPIAAVAAVAWLAAPPLGLAWTLGAMLFPLFNVSSGVGFAALLGFVPLMMVGRRWPLEVAWAGLAVLLVPVYAVLVAPVGAAAFGRRRGPLTAAWAAAVVFVCLTVSGARGAPFTGFSPRAHLGAQLSAAVSPLTVIARVGAVVLSAPCLLQMAAWAGLAFAFAVLLRLDRLELRLWVWAGAFACLFAGYRLVPRLAWERTAPPHALLLAVAVAAALSLAVVAIAPPLRPRLEGPPAELAEPDGDVW